MIPGHGGPGGTRGNGNTGKRKDGVMAKGEKTGVEWAKAERSLLLYLETCAVDYDGRVCGARMNREDFEIAERWDRFGYVRFGRIEGGLAVVSQSTHWCELSEVAWRDAHARRR